MPQMPRSPNTHTHIYIYVYVCPASDNSEEHANISLFLCLFLVVAGKDIVRRRIFLQTKFFKTYRFVVLLEFSVTIKHNVWIFIFYVHPISLNISALCAIFGPNTIQNINVAIQSIHNTRMRIIGKKYGGFV